MSISSEITRLQTLRNNIRTKLIALGIISDSSASLNDCYTGINGITKKTAQTYTPTTSNQTIASGQYLSGAQTISGDANLIAGNIKSGVSIFGVEGSHAGQKTEQSKTVTPTASGFTVLPDSGKVLSSVVINGDVDLVAGNVKKNVNIFGVTGTLEEGITPTGTISITENGTHDVTNYASANVDVSMFTEETIYISTYTGKSPIGLFIYEICGKNNVFCKITHLDEITPQPYALIDITFGLSMYDSGLAYYRRYNSSSSLDYGFGIYDYVSVYPAYGKRYKIQKGDVPQ